MLIVRDTVTEIVPEFVFGFDDGTTVRVTDDVTDNDAKLDG